MSQVRRIQELNEAELKAGTPVSSSWHQDYRDTSFIYIGNLPKEMNEMDILIMFSQYGVPTFLKLVRDRETGESKRFAFLKYEDFRSTILAVDNFNGYEIIPGYILQVDHVRYHNFKYIGDNDANIEWDNALYKEMQKDFATEKELTKIEDKKEDESDDELADPMAGYLEDNTHHHHHHHHHHHKQTEKPGAI